MGTPVVFGDRILVETTTTGTGTYQIGAAVTGYLTFALAAIASGARVPYVAVDSLTAPTAFEIGEGVYASGSPATLARTQIRRNTTGGTTAINWGAGTKYVMLAPAAANVPAYDTDGYLATTAPAGGANNAIVPTTAWVQAEIAAKAPLASPTFTGIPAAPTPAAGTNTTQLATTAFLQAALLGGPVRAWCRFTPAGAIVAGYNVASITKGGTGGFTFFFSTNLPSSNYFATAAPTPFNIMPNSVSGYAVSSFAMQFANIYTNTNADPSANTTMIVLGG
jgi:hypothetical protein